MGTGVSDSARARRDHRRRPARGALDPTADESLPPDHRTGSALGIDATYPYGTVVKAVGDVCGPALAEHGREFVEVADIPGWRDYDIPELDAR